MPQLRGNETILGLNIPFVKGGDIIHMKGERVIRGL